MIDNSEIHKIIRGILGKYMHYFKEQQPRSRKRRQVKRRGKYAEKSVSQYFRKKGCSTFTMFLTLGRLMLWLYAIIRI